MISIRPRTNAVRILGFLRCKMSYEDHELEVPEKRSGGRRYSRKESAPDVDWKTGFILDLRLVQERTTC